MEGRGANNVQFPLLSDSASYKPETFDYTTQADKPGLPDAKAWLEVFRKSVLTFKQHAATASADIPDERQRQAAVEQFAASFSDVLDKLERDPTAEVPGYQAQPLSCITLCDVREQVLKEAGFRDIFRPVKDKENRLALQLLPQLLAQLDCISNATQRLEVLVRGVFAGNLFDLGAAASAQHYKSNGTADFATTRSQLLPRPWVVDDLDALLQRFASEPSYAKAIMFVDNAGSDVMLGMLPLARELLSRGTAVVMAANAAPTINDITLPELEQCLAQAGRADARLGAALASSQLRAVSNGSHLPVIDLRSVSAEVAAECSGCDLVILEGMGRSIETNLHAAFSCDSLNMGMIKHPEVAACLGGRLYDCVCRFRRCS